MSYLLRKTIFPSLPRRDKWTDRKPSYTLSVSLFWKVTCLSYAKICKGEVWLSPTCPVRGSLWSLSEQTLRQRENMFKKQIWSFLSYKIDLSCFLSSSIHPSIHNKLSRDIFYYLKPIHKVSKCDFYFSVVYLINSVTNKLIFLFIQDLYASVCEIFRSHTY